MTNKLKILLTLTLLLAVLLRVFKLGEFPATLYGDEQAFAWNAYNILLTGADEYGTPYPLQFRSFNDYKAPIPVYLLVPFLKIFGMTAFGIRLPIVLASVITVFVTFLLAKQFLNEKTSLIITFLMAVSPWHVHLTRGYFEATLSLLFFVTAIYLFVKSKLNIKLFLVSMVFFALSIYSYFTPRILLPIFLIFLLIYSLIYHKSGKIHPEKSRMPEDSKQVIKTFLIGLIFLFIISSPLLKETFFGKGFSRFDKLMESTNNVIVSTVNRERNASNLPYPWRTVLHNKFSVWLRLVKDNYLEHLSANFWYIYGDDSLRYFTGNMGMFYLMEAPFFILGLYLLLRENRKAAVFYIGWILLAPIPASLAGRPFAVRSLALLPAPFIFAGYGIYRSVTSVSKINLRIWLTGLISIGYVLALSSLLVRYYLEYPVYAATWWGWENKAAIDYAAAFGSKYDNIFISDFYTGAPLAYAVYTTYDPVAFRYARFHPVTMADSRHLIKLGKYYFGSLDIDSKRLHSGIIPPKSLYIGRPEEADSGENITAPDDGRVIFKVYKTE